MKENHKVKKFPGLLKSKAMQPLLEKMRRTLTESQYRSWIRYSNCFTHAEKDCPFIEKLARDINSSVDEIWEFAEKYNLECKNTNKQTDNTLS